jgi:hypothetical protein
MASVTYTGPAGEVFVPALDLTVARGVPVEVSDETVLAGLVGNPEWSITASKATKDGAK